MLLENGIKKERILLAKNVQSEFVPKKKNQPGTSKAGTLELLTVVKNHDIRNLLVLDRKNHGNEARRKKTIQNHQTLAHRKRKENEKSGKRTRNLHERKNGIQRSGMRGDNALSFRACPGI
jgi:hypothetical protein